MDRSESVSGAEDPNLGRTLHERYRIEERIGSGSMGAVYRAWDRRREQACAVKLLRLHVASRESVVVRFCDEARIIARLCHPGIVELYDQGAEPDGTLFLVMELLRGQDLYEHLRLKPRLPLPRVLEIVRQIGSALHTVHLTGVVHRDIKPRNVFLTQRGDSGEPGPVKVIDFGLAKILDGQGSSRGSDGLLIGTPEYLAPEAWRGISSDIDARSDQWSLAVLTYRMLAGRMPFESSSDTVMLAREILGATPCPLRQLVADIPPAIEAAVTQALAKDKELRFRSVLDFIRALHGMPLSGAVQLRRDPATALLDNRDFPTAAMADFRELPTTAVVADYHERATSVPAAGAQATALALDCHNQATAVPVDYSDQPTAAIALVDRSARIKAAAPRTTSATAVLVPTVPSPAPEVTALLPAIPGLRSSAETPAAPYGSADSTQTPTLQHVERSLRWQWFVIGAVLMVTVATNGLRSAGPGSGSEAAAPPAASELLAAPELPELPPLMNLAPPPFSTASKIPAPAVIEAGPSFAPGAPRPSALGVSFTKPRAKTMLPAAKKNGCPSQPPHSHLCRTGSTPRS